MAQKEKTLGADDAARQAEVAKDNKESNEEEDSIVGLAKDAASGAYKGLTEAASKATLGQRAAGLVAGAASTYADGGIAGVAGAAKDGIDAVGSSIANGTALDDAANAYLDLNESLNEGLESTGANAVLGAGKVLGGAASVAADGIGKGASSAAEGASNLSDAAQKTLEKAGSALEGVRDTVGGIAGDAAEGMQEAAGNVASGVSGAAANLGSAAKSFLMGAAHTMGTGAGMVTNVGNAVGEFAGDVIDAYDEGFESQVPSSEEKGTTRRIPNADLMGTDNGASNDFSLVDSMASKYC